MLKHTTSVRVRYADTDKMQFVYNGKYLEYFELEERIVTIVRSGLQPG
jgi:acyl-CoA thioesterase FadM